MLANLAYVAQFQGEYDRAETRWRESLAVYRQLGHDRGIAICLAGFAGLAGAVGEPEHAARLFGAAATLSETVAALWPADRADYEENVARVRAALGQGAFAAAWEEGRTLSLEQALALVSGEE
jgi:non-specific serine/threonine protein kinase